MPPTDYEGANAYQMESEPADLHNVARDRTSPKLEGMVAVNMLSRCTVDVSAKPDRKGLLTGTWSTENPRNERNLDPDRQVKLAIDAQPTPTENAFPQLEGKFRCFKLSGVSSPRVGYIKANQRTGLARERHEMRLVGAVRTQANQDLEIVTAEMIDKADNWQGSTIAELPGGRHVLWSADEARPIDDFIAMAQLFFDNSGMKVSDIKIPLLVARALVRNDQMKGTIVRVGAGGDAGIAIAQGKVEDSFLTSTRLTAIIRDVMANTDGLKDVQVHVPSYRPFLKSKRLKANAADKKYIWNQNSLWLGNLIAGETDFEGADVEITNACAMAQFLNQPFNGRIKDDRVAEQIWGQVDRVMDLQVIHKDAGLHIGDVLSAAA